MGYTSHINVLGCFLLRDELLDRARYYGIVEKTMSLMARKIWLLQADGVRVRGRGRWVKKVKEIKYKLPIIKIVMGM